MNRKVAILMATFNGGPWIAAQLESIFNQVGVEVSLFVSDDGSTDSTLDVIEDFKRRELSIRVLERREAFGSPVRNFFRLVRDVELTHFDYVFFSDQDDLWASDKVHAAIQAMRASEVDCYASDLIALFPDGREVAIKKSHRQKSLDYLFQGASAGCTYGLSRQAALILKDVIFESAEELPGDSSHDWLIYAITRSRGLSWFIDPQPRIKYRQHDRNVYGGHVGISSHVRRMRLIRSGWYRRNIALVARFCRLDAEGQRVVSALERFNVRDRVFLALNSLRFRRGYGDCLLLGASFMFGMGE